MKRLLSILLLAAMLATMLVACGKTDDPDKGGSETTTAGGGDTGSGDETPAETTTHLPERDFEGRAFRWMSSAEFGMITYDEEDMDGTSIYDQAVKKRDAEIKDTYNVVFEDVWCGSKEVTNFALTDAMGTESSYDIASIGGPEGVASLISNNSVLDAKTVPWLNLDAEYYGQQANEEYEIMGKLYFVAGCYPSFPTVCDLMFNKDMMLELGLELPYEDVLDGTFTVEKFLELVAAGYVDADSVAGPSDGDKFGYGGHTASISYFYQGMGGPSTSRDENGAVVPILSNETVNAIFDKLVEFRAMPSVRFNTSLDAQVPTSSHRIFYDGNAMFCYWTTGTLNYSEIDSFERGLAILPKYDEDQERYMCPTVGGIKFFPANIDDVDFAGFIFEALCEASWRITYPADIQEAVDFEQLTDDESVEVRKLVDQSARYDILKNCDPSAQLQSCRFITYCLDNNTTPAVAAPSVQQGIEQIFHDFFYGAD